MLHILVGLCRRPNLYLHSRLPSQTPVISNCLLTFLLRCLIDISTYTQSNLDPDSTNMLRFQIQSIGKCRSYLEPHHFTPLPVTPESPSSPTFITASNPVSLASKKSNTGDRKFSYAPEDFLSTVLLSKNLNPYSNRQGFT